MRQFRIMVIALIAIMMWGSVAEATLMQFDDFMGECDCSIGGMLRIRQENSYNLYTLDHTSANDPSNYYRFRSNLWAKFTWNDYDSAYIRLAHEGRSYLYPSSLALGDAKQTNEVVIDNLNVQLDEFMESPVSLKIGRQDFLGQYGEHFLIADGTLSDGSRTYFFDAIKASIALTENETLDVIFIKNDKKDRKLLSDGAYDTAMNASDETGTVVYLKSTLSDELKGELYYMNKLEKTATKTKLHTIGACAKYNAAEAGTFRGQFAIQTGDYGVYDREGFGGYLFWDKGFDATWSPKLSIGALFLSGDDPNTNKNEGWDPLWSRFPYLNELYSYILRYEASASQSGGGVGYWTNTQLYTARLTIAPIENMSVGMAIDYIRAFEDSTASEYSATASGKTKGISPHLTLKYKFNSMVSFRTQFYTFMPGNFYDKDDKAYFIRHEWLIRF